MSEDLLEITAEDLALLNKIAPALFRKSPMAIVVVDEQGIIRLANEKVSSLLGYSPADLRRQPVEILLPEPLREVHGTKHRPGYMAEPMVRAMGIGKDLFARKKSGQQVPVYIELSSETIDEGTFPIAWMRRIRPEERKIDP